MAISGTLTADFGTFYEACRQAQVELRGFEASNRNVERSLNDMVDSFTGRKIITEAELMATAVGRIGGPARLTGSELQRVGAIAQEAVEKMNRWGQEPPRNILRLADAAKTAGGSLSGAANSIRQVDNVLDLFGVHLGPIRKAMSDVGFAAEQTDGKLGGLAKAGLVLGAGIAGWQIGRAASEFLDLDKKIGDATAKLLGFGDVAGQTAAAKADALARASKTAGFAITDYSLALMINAQNAEKVVSANKKIDDQLARQAGPAFAAQQLKKYNDELDDLKKEGLLGSLTADINTHAFSMQDLSKWYRISTEALSLFAKEAENVGRIERNNVDKLAKLRDDFRAAERADEERKRKEAADKIEADHNALQSAAAAQAAVHEKDAQMLDAQLALRKATEAETAALRRQEEAARAVARAMGNTLDFDLSTKEGMERFKQFNPTAQVSGAATQEYFKTHTLAQAVAEGLVIFQAQNAVNSRGVPQTVLPGFGGPPAAAGGGQGFGQPPVSPFGPEAPLLPAGGLKRSRGDGPRVYAPIHVSGVFDPSSTHALQTTVSHGLERSVLNGRLG